MKIVKPVLLGLSLAVVGSAFAAAQDAASTSSVPMVLQITREYTKPYKGGAAHDKTESAFIAAQARAKFPVYYTAMNSLSGRSRALFMTRYNSFAEWEKDNKIVDKNPTLSEGLERAGIAKSTRWSTPMMPTSAITRTTTCKTTASTRSPFSTFGSVTPRSGTKW
jgi:hypothetical protein